MIENGSTDWNWGLKFACQYGHKEMVQLMIEKGATHCFYCWETLNKH